MQYSAFVLALFLCASAPAQPGGTVEWPQDLNAIPMANGTDIATIESLINRVLASDAISGHIRAFRFLPLESTSRIDLIASIDTSGRGMFNAFVAVWPSLGTYGHAVLPSDVQTVMARDVVDLDGAGVYRVITGTFPGGYQGTNTIPIPWYSVHGLKQGKWVDVSDRYPTLYQMDLIPRTSLLMQVADAGLSGDKDSLQLYKDNGLFIRFKYERAILHTSGAGLESALKWADSSNPSIQVLAAKTLGEIADPRGISMLRTLSESQDVRVHAAARDALAHIGVPLERRQ